MAGGLMLYEIGTDNVGLANAGAAARAQGPSTLASNVAGLIYLPGTQITAGAQMLHGNLEFSQDAGSNIPGGDSGNAMEWAPGGSLFVSHQLDEHWYVGFATYGDFGLNIDYDDDWSGRYFLQDGELIGMTLLPSLAYRLDDHWSFGLGLRAMYGMIDSMLAVDNNPFDILDRPDGSLEYSDNDWGYGVNLGVIYEPQPGTRIGVTYTSEIDLDFEDSLNPEGLDRGVATVLANRGVLGANTQLDMQVPQTLTVSLYHALNPDWALLASVGWQDWSTFGEIGVQLDTGDPRETTLDANYRDTWHLSLGTQYQATPLLLLNFGAAYDSSPVSDHNRTLTVPMSENWRLGTGVTYALDKQTSFNLSYEMVWMGDMPITQEKAFPPNDPKRVSGEFEDAWIQALSGSMTWRF
ncbi:transporter [Pseudomonas sp. DB1]|uniref:Transporter n=2 Tax=Metapseudomonas boanensis TaxID=2822138 RepID=A0ABS5XP31_9GAMM|nr:transporter [Pseudomonas boanensis]